MVRKAPAFVNKNLLNAEVAAIYFTMNLLIIGVVPWREFVPAPGTPLPDPPPPIVSWFIERIYGSSVVKVFTVMVLWTAFASCFSLVLGYSRIPFAAARDGNFFSVFAKVHPRKEFPHVSLLLVGALATLCSFLPLLTVINALLTTRILVQFIGQIGAVVWLRRNQPQAERPFKMWLYPVPAFVALAGWLDFMIEVASALSIVIMHLSRLSEELILWATQEFQFVDLPDLLYGKQYDAAEKEPGYPRVGTGENRSRLWAPIQPADAAKSSAPHL